MIDQVEPFGSRVRSSGVLHLRERLLLPGPGHREPSLPCSGGVHGPAQRRVQRRGVTRMQAWFDG